MKYQVIVGDEEFIADGRHILVTYCKRIPKTEMITNWTVRYKLMRERGCLFQLRKWKLAISKLKNGKSLFICGINRESERITAGSLMVATPITKSED